MVRWTLLKFNITAAHKCNGSNLNTLASCSSMGLPFFVRFPKSIYRVVFDTLRDFFYRRVAKKAVFDSVVGGILTVVRVRHGTELSLVSSV